MKRSLTCIICPRGCALEATITENGVTVSGHTCPKGEEYAINECTNPVRTVTAVVRVGNRENTMVSVKTEKPIPKDHMMDLIDALRQLRLNAPLAIGDVVLQEMFGSAVVVTKGVE